MPELADESVQFCITSTSAWEPLEAAIPEIYRVLKPDGVFILNIGQFPPGSGGYERFKKEGNERAMPLLPHVIAEWVLQGTSFRLEENLINVMSYGIKPRRWICNYEHYFVYSKTSGYYMSQSYPLMAGWLYDRPIGNTVVDAATFDPDVISTLLEVFSKPGSLVLDPLAGRGTLGKVATKLGRDCVLYEINKSLEKAIRENIGRGLIEIAA